MTDLPNVLLVILDSVRARNTSLHGHDRETTPALEEFAADAVTYRQARSPSIHSIASHASIWSGYEVEEHRCIRHESHLQPDSTIWHELGEEGFETGLFTPNSVVAESSNLADVFGTVETSSAPNKRLFEGGKSPMDIGGDIDPVDYAKFSLGSGTLIRTFLNGLYFKYANRKPTPTEPAETFTEQFLDWQESTDGPWAACLNFIDAHYPYLPESEFNLWGDQRLLNLHESIPPGPLAHEFLGERAVWQLRALESLYDGGIRQMDAQIERLLSALAHRGELDDTLVVVTSDHGEGFGERSHLRPDVRMIDHSWGIDEVLTHVPLVVKYPGASADERIDKPAALTRFPDVVRGALDGERRSFATDQVVCSTFRVLPENVDRFADANAANRRVGPWRAVYEESKNHPGVTKYAAVGKEEPASATIHVRDAQVNYATSSDDDDVVRSTFDELSDVNVTRGGESIDEELEDRLSNLGYIR